MSVSGIAGSGAPLVRAGLRTPRAAAIAGMIFSVLLISSLVLLRTSVPANPAEPGAWLQMESGRVTLALYLIPIAGVTFMWFLGVLRDRLGALEDKFFATVFLGSGLMFLGMLFVASAAVGSLIRAYQAWPDTLANSPVFAFGRSFAYDLMNVYAFKMAAVFMITTSTLVIYTRVAARWLAWLGYGSAALILFCSGLFNWTLLVFPCWVLLMSVYVLFDNLHHNTTTAVSTR